MGEVFKPLPDLHRCARDRAAPLDRHQSGNVLYGV